MTSDNKSPARLHAILAREADKSNGTCRPTGSSLASGSTGASIRIDATSPLTDAISSISPRNTEEAVR